MVLGFEAGDKVADGPGERVEEGLNCGLMKEDFTNCLKNEIKEGKWYKLQSNAIERKSGKMLI